MTSTTIALSRKVYDRLQAVKHKIEKENHCGYSFGKTISYLLDQEETNAK